jgi:hypothetical protein
MVGSDFLWRNAGDQCEGRRSAPGQCSLTTCEDVRRKDGRRERKEIRAASSVFLDSFGYQLLPGSFAVEAFTGFAGLVLFCTALLEAFPAFFGFFMRKYV